MTHWAANNLHINGYDAIGSHLNVSDPEFICKFVERTMQKRKFFYVTYELAISSVIRVVLLLLFFGKIQQMQPASFLCPEFSNRGLRLRWGRC